MIITRTPLRVSFVGGGSDLASYYKKFGGMVISSTINKYIYINVHRSFGQGVRVAYSQVEEVESFDRVEHPLVRGAAKLMGFNSGLEITSIADIPARGSGLGSSSSFSVGLLHALSVMKKLDTSRAMLAELACKLEIELCYQPIGKQDQYAASFGGFNIFEFKQDGSVGCEKLHIPDDILHKLTNHLMVFYTGNTRSASSILKEQNIEMQNDSKVKMLQEMVALVRPFKAALENGDMEACGRLLDINWQLKRKLTKTISSDTIDQIYSKAVFSGAWGGKLLGAGGSGFMLFIVPPERQNSVALALSNYQRQYWQFESAGTSIIHSA